MKAMTGITSADYKVPGGKLLRVRLSGDSTQQPPTITRVTLTGDFFMHPEEAIEELEAALVGVLLTQKTLQERIEAFLGERVQVIGAAPEDFAHVIMIAYARMAKKTNGT